MIYPNYHELTAFDSLGIFLLVQKQIQKTSVRERTCAYNLAIITK
jgi:hypothetical protein